MSHRINTLSRREFLKTAGAAGVATLLGGTGFRRDSDAATKQRNGPMPLRPFGKTGVNVPILGFGGSQNLKSKQRLLRQAVKLGVTYWDTAEVYTSGGSEEAMGQYFRMHPEDREKVFLVTKSRATQPSRLSKSLDQSLKRLNTDRVDLFLIHDISSPDVMDADIQNWAGKMKAEGKIRFMGFSSHSNMESCMMGAARLGWIDGIMVSYNYRLMIRDEMKRAVGACAEAGVGLTAMKTQAGWSWGDVGKESSPAQRPIQRFSEEGFTKAQAKLKAVWDNPLISTICSEMTNLKILTANVAAALNKTRLSREDRRLLDQYAQETAPQYCAGCAAICEPLMERSIPIRDTMRSLMYARYYGEHERGVSLFRKAEPTLYRQMKEIDYRLAENACPQGMPIARLMREAVDELS